MAALALFARPQRVRKSSKQSLRRLSQSHPASLLDREAPLERHIRLSPTLICGACHTGAQKKLLVTTLQREWPDTSVQRKHAGDTNMQHSGCQLAFSVHAFSCGQKSTPVLRCYQERPVRNTILPSVCDEDDDGHTWPGDTDILAASDSFIKVDIFDSIHIYDTKTPPSPNRKGKNTTTQTEEERNNHHSPKR